MDTLATSLLGTYQADFRPMMNAYVNVNQCETTYYVGPTQVTPGLAVNPLAGTRAGTALPASCCGVVNWHTGFDHYRGGHARSYITGPVVGDDQTPSTYTAAYVAALLAKAQSFLGSVNAYAGAPFTSLELAMLTRIRDKQPLTTPVLRPITAASVRTIIGTQRRRLT